MLKQCNKCGEDKPAINKYFGNNKIKLNARCKNCDSEYQQTYREKNKEKLKLQQRNKYLNKREEIIEKSQKWYLNNKDYKKQYDKERNVNNLKYRSKRAKKYYQENKEEIKYKTSQYTKQRYKTDEAFRIKVNLRHRLNEAFKRFSKNGKVKSSKDYGINWQEIIEYIGSCPGDRNEHHIDHIVPLSAFNFDNLVHIKIAFSPQNHRWLNKKDNLRKHNKYRQKDFDDLFNIT
jgi:hypothetical protein